MENNTQNILGDIQRALGLLEGKVDRLQKEVSEVKGDVKNSEERLHAKIEKLDERLRAVERKTAIHWYVIPLLVSGVASLIALTLGYAFGLL